MDIHSDEATGGPSAPHEIIRLLRKRSGMTLSDVSAKTGLTISVLSKLERGRISLSYDKLMLLSKGLGVEMGQLLNTSQQTPSSAQVLGSPQPASSSQGSLHGAGRRVVHRVGEGQELETSSYRQLYLATEFLNKRFTPLIGEAKVRTVQEFIAEFGDLIRHPGEEFALVLEGEIEFHTEFYAPLRLKTGDSVYFDSEMGHAYLKGSDEPCRMVAVCSPQGDDAEITEAIAMASERHASKQAQPIPPPPRVKRKSKPD